MTKKKSKTSSKTLTIEQINDLSPEELTGFIHSIRKKQVSSANLSVLELKLIQPRHTNVDKFISLFKELSKAESENEVREFYKWLLEVSRVVEIRSYKNISRSINEFTNWYKPNIKGCFETAFACTQENEGIEFVSGFIDNNGVFTEHSWNCNEETHFDLTAEVAWGAYQFLGEKYIRILKLSKNELDSLSKTSEAVDQPLRSFITEGYERHLGNR